MKLNEVVHLKSKGKTCYNRDVASLCQKVHTNS